MPLAEQVNFVSAIHDALKQGGSLVCTVPNANSAMASRYRYGDYTHTCSFTEQSLDFLLFHGGFSAISVTADEVETRPRWPWLLRPSLRWWYLKRAFRSLRRLEFMVELHGQQGRDVPLSLNLLASPGNERTGFLPAPTPEGRRAGGRLASDSFSAGCLGEMTSASTR